MFKKLLAVAALMGVTALAHATVIQCDSMQTGSSLNPNIMCNSFGFMNVIQGQSATYNITAATVVKAGQGTLVRVNVITAGSTAGTVNNTTTTGGASASNEVMSVPNTVGTYYLNWPMSAGIVVVPGTGQVIAVSYN